MANFPMDPLIYVPRGGVLIDGGGALRKMRCVVMLSGQHVKKNEDLAIANCDEAFTALERHEFLLLIHHHLTHAPSGTAACSERWPPAVFPRGGLRYLTTSGIPPQRVASGIFGPESGLRPPTNDLPPGTPFGAVRSLRKPPAPSPEGSGPPALGFGPSGGGPLYSHRDYLREPCIKRGWKRT
ncbi:hypothetical protein GUJ93_ZPchr0010g10373 [Zizania palustris]|uniref:DUF7597 domain-containing protein n=1 Tax=Zizania palustris TaxID=103762 RepID=A0A8J5W981_ZIZPA|nr:hypothetical protein GUJ93_ZPchr0010g10373 [Zizania palustris]